MAPVKETVLKLTSMRYKKEGVSEKEFHDHCSKSHAPRAAIVQERHGALKVAQYHTPSVCRDLFKDKIAWAARPGFVIDDHDIQISVWVRTTEQMFAILTDPDFQQLTAEEMHLVDMERATVVAGWEEVYVEDGKIVNVEEGKSLYGPYEERSNIGSASQKTTHEGELKF